MEDKVKIGILGAGFSGKMLAARLLSNSAFASTVKIYLIDTSFKGGVAYGTPDESHLLNVRAANMSALYDKPNHLIEYLSTTYGEDDWKGKFISRAVYSKYIDSIFLSSISKSLNSFERINGEVSSVKKEGAKLRVVISKEELELDHLVLAHGNIHSNVIPTNEKPFLGKAAWPLDSKALSKDKILFVGTSLTMLDLALSTSRLNPDSKIFAVSRNGLLPAAHTALDQDRLLKIRKHLEQEFLNDSSLRNVVSRLRSYTEEYPWREVVDAIRPFTVKLWKGFSDRERKFFNRRLSTFWSIHRHRVSPEVMEKLQSLTEKGILRIIPGKILSIEKKDNSLVATIKERHGKSELIEVEEIINCTGPASLRQLSSTSFFQSLLSQNLISQDKLGLGISMKESLDQEVFFTKQISSLGPPLRGELLECTAVPELRNQVERLAQLMESHSDH